MDCIANCIGNCSLCSHVLPCAEIYMHSTCPDAAPCPLRMPFPPSSSLPLPPRVFPTTVSPTAVNRRRQINKQNKSGPEQQLTPTTHIKTPPNAESSNGPVPIAPGRETSPLCRCIPSRGAPSLVPPSTPDRPADASRQVAGRRSQTPYLDDLVIAETGGRGAPGAGQDGEGGQWRIPGGAAPITEESVGKFRGLCVPEATGKREPPCS